MRAGAGRQETRDRIRGAIAALRPGGIVADCYTPAGMSKRIRRLFADAPSPRIAIVGAGFSGIALGVKLMRAGIFSYDIYEMSPSLGGTWLENTYPGCEVDVASHVYSYSFAHPDWTRTHASQKELLAYLERVADEFGVRPHIHCNTRVIDATWDESAQEWTVRLSSGEAVRANIVVSAVGMLNDPRMPDWPGLDAFRGPKFHTARWQHEHDLAGKTVAVVGTGSTAIQVVPAIAPIAKQVIQFQREPGWVMFKGDRDFTPEERTKFKKPLHRRLERLRLAMLLERGVRGGAIYRPGTKTNAAREAYCRALIAKSFADRPDLAAAVTPTYPYPGKRPIFHSTYYEALKRDNVELVPKAVASITERGVVDVDGVEHPADVLVIATGFEASRYLPKLEIVGRGGRTIHEVWNGEPNAFLGLTVPGFPNFFMMYGPGTNGGELVSMFERQAEHVVRVAKRLRRGDIMAVEVKPHWNDLYNRWLQSKMQGTSWTLSRNYFTSASGKVVTQWPYGAVLYGMLVKLLGPLSEKRLRVSGR
jgi:cation diffusion facilitator CzcD-associated flavoprotein CzcO